MSVDEQGPTGDLRQRAAEEAARLRASHLPVGSGFGLPRAGSPRQSQDYVEYRTIVLASGVQVLTRDRLILEPVGGAAVPPGFRVPQSDRDCEPFLIELAAVWERCALNARNREAAERDARQILSQLGLE